MKSSIKRTYAPSRFPTKKATTAAIPPIISVFNPDLTGDLLTSFPITSPIDKKEMVVNIIE